MTNKEKVQEFMDLGKDPQYGLTKEERKNMFKLYEEVTGSKEFWNIKCELCADTIYRKFKDFLKYDDNIGRPLIDWEGFWRPVEVEPKLKKLLNTKNDKSQE